MLKVEVGGKNKKEGSFWESGKKGSEIESEKKRGGLSKKRPCGNRGVGTVE